MFKLDEDKTIYVTRGDIAFFSVSAETDGELYKFQKGEVVRIKVMDKKNCSNVYFQKDFAITEECEKVDIFLSEEDTKFGELINKAKDYWYEIELNPYTNPQTIIGYDEDGAKIFKLFPEGRDLGNEAKKEDVPVVDSELSMTSTRPIENQAVTRALMVVENDCEQIDEHIVEFASEVLTKKDFLAKLEYDSTEESLEILLQEVSE